MADNFEISPRAMLKRQMIAAVEDRAAQFTDYQGLALRIKELDEQLRRTRAELEAACVALNNIQHSPFWRITRPARWVMSAVPAPARRSARLALRTLKRFGRRNAAVGGELLETGFTTPQSAHAEPGAGSAKKTPACSQGRVDWEKPFVLVIDGNYPRPDMDSGSIDTVNFISAFQAMGYQVFFAAHAEYAFDGPARSALTANGVYCIGPNSSENLQTFCRTAAAAMDVCVLSRVDCGGLYFDILKRAAPAAKIIYNTVDLHHRRYARAARLVRDMGMMKLARQTRLQELTLARQADATIVVSASELAVLQNCLPQASVWAIPLARDCPGSTAGFASRTAIGFIGGFAHAPNPDAVRWFLDTVWPRVRQDLPAVMFHVIGANLPDDLRLRQDPGFVVTGHAKDLKQAFAPLRLTVAPLRFGAGAKGKVVSSLAHGVPCVASPIAAEGMELVDGHTITLASSAEDFAREIVALYKDEARWQKLSDRGAEIVRQNFSFSRTHQALQDLLLSVDAPVPSCLTRDRLSLVSA